VPVSTYTLRLDTSKHQSFCIGFHTAFPKSYASVARVAPSAHHPQRDSAAMPVVPLSARPGCGIVSSSAANA